MNLKTGLLAGTIALTTLNGCKRGPLHIIDKNTNKIVEHVDSFTKSKYNHADTTGLTFFKTDTLEIVEKSLKDHQWLGNRLQKVAASRTPQKTVGRGTTFGYTVGPHMSPGGSFKIGPGMGYYTEDIREPLYTDVKAIMQNKVYATQNNKSFYIPVDYYGKPNPKLLQKDSVK